MNVHLVSFGAPFESFVRAHFRFVDNAKSFGEFSSINLFSERNIYDISEEIKKYKNFLSSTRGYGYWMWKYFLLSEIMKNISEGDLVCYADIGCTFNNQGLINFEGYKTITSDRGSLCFDLGHLERAYTKMDTYLRVFPDNMEHLNTGQRCATTFFLKNNQVNRDIIEEIKEICVENNHHYITDVPSSKSNHPEFREHRHDQSVFSLISKKYKFYCIPDQTYWDPDWNNTGRIYPIWATRNKF